MGERGELGNTASRATSALEARALHYFDSLAATPLSLRASICLVVVIGSLFIISVLPNAFDLFAGRDVAYPAIFVSALLCGGAGGVASVAVFMLFGHLGVVQSILGQPVAPLVHFSVYFDFLFDSAAYIAFARLPYFLVRARRAADELARVEAEQLRHFVEQTPAAMAMFDQDMNYLATSARWRDINDLDGDAKGISHYALHPNLPEAWKDAHRRGLNGETVRCEQDGAPLADGSERWVRWEVRPWRLGSGQIGGIVIFAEDITERIRMQQELFENERRLEAIFDTAMDAIVTIGADCMIRSANPAAEDIFGHRAEELLGRDVKLLMSEPFVASDDRLRAAQGQIGVKQIIGQRRVVEGLRKNGEVFPLELTVSEAALNGDVLFVGIMRDLSPIEAERRRVSLLREELAHVSRLNDMGEMVAGLAHEVGQPLAAILNFAAAYRRALATKGKAPEPGLIGKIEEQARRATEILKRLRGFIEKRPPEQREVAVAALIDDALELVSLRSHAKIVRAPVPSELDDARVLAEPILIQQVLVNLLRNADDALIDAETPEIVVETSRVGRDRVRIAVADNGAGVAGDAVPQLFEPFFTTRHDGMGVGLSISKSIVESHGGAIAYRPNAPRGSIFEFELPLCSDYGGVPDAAVEEVSVAR
ncbi:PAS domain S-box protein [Rhodoblastus acidophilus]|uniref:histidine kinase n=1 Tax=Candidatus Rhodoblastus alkanivorans TaxID=2954117 RepID=A0ABS9ZCQ6_9HYPH|nr:PAS domain S-box protein [Candidatus Rhodoblastus alkanivorans]MCI4679831.1 PAS domain S-box protein [Candidatus Rhodoblastus alkanivorans]MCI4684337.1 PAS domain S-box protein [Candidatus Rhodoblastus alkanivorans]MDI4641658.1 PAS domain S-box protein [Rhodoblastus acidophilus]